MFYKMISVIVQASGSLLVFERNTGGFMKIAVTHSARRTKRGRTVDQNLSLPIAWSSLGHLVFILLVIVLPRFTPEASAPSHIINVQLVAARALAPVSPPAAQQKEAAPEVAPEPVQTAAVSTASKPKEAVPLAPKEIEKKRSMKKKTYQRERVLESAIKNVEKRVEASKPDPKQQALDEIRSELRDREAAAAPGESMTTAGAASISSDGKPTTDIQLIYGEEVRSSIQRHWAFSDQMTGGETNLYNIVAVTIQRSGTIEDVRFERRSGNSYFDESTYRAILKSNPLPPIPGGISGSSITIRFRFIPEGL